MVALQKGERGKKEIGNCYSAFRHSHHQESGPAFMRRKGAEPTGSDIAPPPAEEMPSRVKNNLAL